MSMGFGRAEYDFIRIFNARFTLYIGLHLLLQNAKVWMHAVNRSF